MYRQALPYQDKLEGIEWVCLTGPGMQRGPSAHGGMGIIAHSLPAG